MCARKTSHTALDCYSNNPERLICSPCAFGQSLYRVLIQKIDHFEKFEQECTRWWVKHRRTLYVNVDSVKTKVPFYTTDRDILRVVSMHRIVIHCIDISMNRYTPNKWWVSLVLWYHNNGEHLVMVQKTIIDTLHKESKSQRVITESGGSSKSAVSKHIKCKVDWKEEIG